MTRSKSKLSRWVTRGAFAVIACAAFTMVSAEQAQAQFYGGRGGGFSLTIGNGGFGNYGGGGFNSFNNFNRGYGGFNNFEAMATVVDSTTSTQVTDTSRSEAIIEAAVMAVGTVAIATDRMAGIKPL